MAIWHYALLFAVLSAQAMEQKKVEEALSVPVTEVKATEKVLPEKGAAKDSLKDVPKRDPFASSEVVAPIKATTSKDDQDFIVHGIAIAEKPYALISYGNNLFTLTLNDSIGNWRVAEITLDAVQIKSRDGVSKQLPLELRVNSEGA